MTSHHNNSVDLLDKNSKKDEKEYFVACLNKINKSFLYAEMVLIFSVFLLIIGVFLYIYAHLDNSIIFTNIDFLETSVITLNMLFILFLLIIMFSVGYKFLLDIFLWKTQKVKKPLIISSITLLIIFSASFLSPFFAFLTILISALSVGLRIHTEDFLELSKTIIEYENDK